MRRLDDVLRSTLRTGAEPSAAPTDASSSRADQTDAEGPVCPRCGGPGFVRRQLPLGHPDFGRAVACNCAEEETDAERRTRLQRYSKLGSLTRYTFARLVPRPQASGGAGVSLAGPERPERYYEDLVQIARAFAAQPEGWLVLTGESGSGKTHVAAAIANDVVSRGQPALFMSVPDLLDHLRATFGPDSEIAYDSLFEQVCEAPLLVLDDLGVQSPTPWANEKIDQIINRRYTLRLPTVFTLAVGMETLDPRLRTRLTDPEIARVLVFETGLAKGTNEPDPLSLPLLAEMTFQSFDYRPTGPDLPDHVARKLQQAYVSARNFALRPEGWLVLAGETGCGKTHLAAAVAHQQRAAGKPYLFVAVPDLLDRLRGDAHAQHPREAPEFIERVRTCPFLVLDDLGVHSDTPWAQEKLFQILNHRYNAKLPTVITVRPSDELPAAIRSRLYDDKVSLFVEIAAPDYRNPERPRDVPARRGRPSRQ